MTKIKEIGEFNFINKIIPNFSELVGDGMLGIGDDCAVIKQGDSDLLVTTDMLVEDIHFIRSEISAYELGYKSLAVNISDIAAMGGHPLASFISLAIPADMEVSYLDEFYRGYAELSKKYNMPLLGGDTTKSLDKFVINVVALGRGDNNKIKFRSGAKANQYVCVTGFLGDSACGLEQILRRINNKESSLIDAHYLPKPRIEEGLFLADKEAVGAMMDVSDGIGSDLNHIIKASGIGVNIFLEKIPISEQMMRVSSELGLNKYELAVGGGEDYELLFTLDKETFDELAREYLEKFSKEIFIIGETCAEREVGLNYLENGLVCDKKIKGFNHF